MAYYKDKMTTAKVYKLALQYIEQNFGPSNWH